MSSAEYCTVAEAAQRLALTPAGVRAVVDRGELPAIRTECGTRFFVVADVEKLVAERARRAANLADGRTSASERAAHG